jgi:hypothetical protein
MTETEVTETEVTETEITETNGEELLTRRRGGHGEKRT